jgi:hypothetical protein
MAQPIEQAKKLREMLSQVECSKDHCCVQSGFRDLCRAKDIFGSGKHLMCLEDSGTACEYQIKHCHANVCDCPVRFYLHRELGI